MIGYKQVKGSFRESSGDQERKEGECCTYWRGRIQVFQRKIRINSKIRNCKGGRDLEDLKSIMLTA